MIRKKRLALLIAALLCAGWGSLCVAAEKKATTQPTTEDRFEISNIEGWTVYLNRDVRKQHPEQLAQTLDHLRWELYQIKLAVPAAAASNIQENTPVSMQSPVRAPLSNQPHPGWLTPLA